MKIGFKCICSTVIYGFNIIILFPATLSLCQSRCWLAQHRTHLVDLIQRHLALKFEVDRLAVSAKDRHPHARHRNLERRLEDYIADQKIYKRYVQPIHNAAAGGGEQHQVWFRTLWMRGGEAEAR